MEKPLVEDEEIELINSQYRIKLTHINNQLFSLSRDFFNIQD